MRTITSTSSRIEVTNDNIFEVLEILERFDKHVSVIPCTQQRELSVIELRLSRGPSIVAMNLEGMGKAIKAKVNFTKVAAKAAL
jgi:hypothetical protein